MKYRKLRIAWSVAWGIAAMLLVLLWGRSYQSMDQLCGPISGTRIIVVGSINGHLLVNWPFHDWGYAWNIKSSPLNAADRPSFHFDIECRRLPDGFAISQWFLVVFSIVVAACPWLQRRFTTRTLLIATTLIAVALGLIVWLC